MKTVSLRLYENGFYPKTKEGACDTASFFEPFLNHGLFEMDFINRKYLAFFQKIKKAKNANPFRIRTYTKGLFLPNCKIGTLNPFASISDKVALFSANSMTVVPLTASAKTFSTAAF